MTVADSNAPGEQVTPARAAPTIDELMAAGMALIRVPRGAKSPAGKGWNRPERVMRVGSPGFGLLRGNVGLAHAYCTPTPTAAIDLDNCKAADRWLRDRGIDLRALLFAPDAVVIYSGTPNRLKLLYRLPAGQQALPTKPLKGADGKMMLEFRCATAAGLTVHDLLPPSVHPSGRVYQWMGAGLPTAPPVLPQSLLDTWRALLISSLGDPAERAREQRERFVAARDETPRQIAVLREMLRHVSADCDYPEWRDVVFAILSTRWKCAEEVAREWSMSAFWRFDEHAFQVLVDSYQPDRVVARTMGTIIFYARRGGWNG